MANYDNIAEFISKFDIINKKIYELKVNIGDISEIVVEKINVIFYDFENSEKELLNSITEIIPSEVMETLKNDDDYNKKIIRR